MSLTRTSVVRKQLGRRALKSGAFAAGLLAASSAFGLTINFTYDSSVVNLGTTEYGQVQTALNYVSSQFAGEYTNPISVNVYVQATSNSGVLGQSSGEPLYGYTQDSTHSSYTPLRSALLANDPGVSLPASDPSPGGANQWYFTKAEGKALNLLANDSTSDGTFTFGTNFGGSYTFDPNNRAVPGEVDFIGVAEHEVSEIMGRIPGLGTSGYYLPFDLYRFTAANTRSFSSTASGVYFSTNNGVTNLRGFNSISGADPQDWDSARNDSFNAFSNSGVKNDMFSTEDISALHAIGYIPAPEPATLGILPVLATTALLRRRRASAAS